MKIIYYKDFKESTSNVNVILPTYEECREICDSNDNFIFYESKTKIENYNISIFNNRLAQPVNFSNPIPGKNIKADELRGIVFVFNKDGTLYKRFLLLNKFWNMNQSPCSMYSVVKEFKIKYVADKLDGSIGSFIQLPNGKIIAKSKTSFETTQANGIQKIYDTNENIKRFVDYCFANEIMPIFEFISPTNRIVLKYAQTELVLTKIRDNNTGEYLDINNYKNYLDGITIASVESGHTLDGLIELSKVLKEREGWVIQFTNGHLLKLKTDWYVSLHRLVDKTTRENMIIEMILNETIDDAYSMLDKNDLRRKRIEDIDSMLKKYIVEQRNNIEILLKDFHGDYKEFALKYKKEKNFSICMSILRNNKDILDCIKERILDETKTLSDAIDFVKKIEK